MNQQNYLQRMETAPAVRFDPRLMSTPPRWLAPLLGALGSENGKPSLMAAFAVTTEQSQWISTRLSDLKMTLESDDMEVKSKAISITKLQSVLGNAAATDDFADVRAEVYLDALAEFPAWAVEAAAMRWIRGEGLGKDDNPVFVPKPVQLIRIVRALLNPFEREARQLQYLTEAVALAA